MQKKKNMIRINICKKINLQKKCKPKRNKTNEIAKQAPLIVIKLQKKYLKANKQTSLNKLIKLLC